MCIDEACRCWRSGVTRAGQDVQVTESTDVAQSHWWDRIRGARAISWQSVVVGNLLISVAIVASGGTLGGYAIEPDARVRALAAVLAAGAVTAVWAVFGFLVLFRNRRSRPVSLWIYFAFYAVNAIAYFACVQWLDNTSAEPSGIGWPARLASSIAIAWAWAISISLILDNADRFRARRLVLLDELVAAELERVRESHEAMRLREALGAQVDVVLAETRDRLARALKSSSYAPGGVWQGNEAEAANIVRSAASDVVRPLSHRLQQMADASYPAPRFSGVVRQLWRHPRMPPLATAVLVSAQTTAESVRNFGGTLGPLLAILYFLGLYGFLLLVDRAARRFPSMQRTFYLVGVVGSISLNVWYAEGLSNTPVDAGDVVALMVLSLTYIIVTSLYDALRQARVGLLETLSREVDADELRTRAIAGEMALAVDALARELHGRVQTQLVVCAAELDRAAEAGDHDAVTRCLAVAASVLESATRARVLTFSDVIDAWASVLDIRIEVSDTDQKVLTRADVVTVVEEGLANAYRHGEASHAEVRLSRTNDSLQVRIVDDGHGFAEADAGLGTRLLRSLSQDKMVLECGPMGTQLTVHLPLEMPA